jgi:hypothetical protein
MRPSWLLFVPFAALVGITLYRKRMETAVHSAIAIAVICVCLSPWWIRNYRVTGQFVPTTLQVGISLKDGLNPLADGASDLERVRFTEIAEPIPPGKLEWTLNEYYRDDAFRWAESNPSRALQLVGIKFSRMWNVIPNEAMFRSWPIKLLVAVTFTPIFVLGCMGVMKFSRLGWPYLLAGLPVLYFTLLHVIFVASIRYREPAMLGLIVLASAVIVNSRRQTCRPAVVGLDG